MSDNETKRERARRERREAERTERSQEQRTRAFKLIGAVSLVAILAVAVLIVAGQAGTDDARDVDVHESLAGITQDGSVLGEPDAEVTLVEFGDMRCPHCRDFANEVMPGIIDGPVREGRLRVDFRNWPILGPESVLAAKATMAAGEQGRYWEFLETFYLEPDPDVDLDFLRDVAEDAGVADLDAWEAAIEDPRFEEEIEAINREAAELGIGGTPSFAIETPDGERIPVESPGSAEDLEGFIGRYG